MKKVKIEIKNRFTGNILFEYEKENNTIKDTVQEAVKQGAYLGGANLRGANLGGAYIYLTDSNDDDYKGIIKEFEENAGIKITEYYVNHDIIPTRWNCFWRNGLIIREWEVKPKEIKKMTVKQICDELGYDVEIIKEEK